jgi:hypothetical protein
MVVLGCIAHWYVSMLYVVPVLAVGAWGWWSARRRSGGRGGDSGGARRRAAGRGI